jgi:indoleamine 2,3-dioxygenase
VHESWRTQSASSVPERVAVPWVTLAKNMDRLPALAYYSHGLCNWRRFNHDEPVELGNIAVLRNFFGGLDENWFVAVHVDIEAKAIPLVDAVVSAQESVSSHDEEYLQQSLSVIGDSLEAMLCTLARISENCDPDIFFNRVQPFMQGLRHMYYEGVGEFNGQPQNFAGGSGAQSALMPLLDAALGIEHAKDDLLVYLSDLRRYMPSEHRDFLREVESGPSIRALVLREQNEALVDAYNRCVEGVATFRANHLRMSVDYIQRPAKKASDARGGRGTGGSPYVGYLKKHREETFAALI